MKNPKPGQVFRDKLKVGGKGPLMVVIPTGQFMMGSSPREYGGLDRERPQHMVRISRPFALGVYTVTLDEYDLFCEATKQVKTGDLWGRGKQPVIFVSWEDAQEYCDWLSQQTGRTYRLPSEAEWEFACRAGTITPFHFGASINTSQANFNGSYPYIGSAKGQHRGQALPVGSFPPNAFGLHDMHGNVWEWCRDAWHHGYKDAPADGLAWEAFTIIKDTLFHYPQRVVRGGSYDHSSAYARSASRLYQTEGEQLDVVGFRVACSTRID